MGADPVETAARARREMEPAWDDLRERRVLGRIGEARRARPRTSRRPRRVVVGGAVAAFAVAALALLAWNATREPGPVANAHPPERAAAEHETATDVRDPARLDLADGSVALLSSDARVRVVGQTAEEVAIAQQAGTVTYDVAHVPSRAFVVRAAHATVTVRGTRFTVAMDGTFVEVRVDEGRVEVAAHGSTTLLTRGEHIRVGSVDRRIEAADVDVEGEGEARGTAPAPAPEAVEPDGPRTRARSQGGEAAVARAERDDGPAAEEAAPGLAELQREADVARRGGRVAEAISLLRSGIEAHPNDPRAPGALFTLGRLERRQGRHAEAAAAFSRAREIAPRGPLAEDALAEEAASWAEAGDALRAATAARRYLDTHPDGLHAQRMRALAR